MAGTFMLGEMKIRPGSYFNIQKKGDGPASGAKNGIVGVLFKSDWGPLNQQRQGKLEFISVQTAKEMERPIPGA